MIKSIKLYYIIIILGFVQFIPYAANSFDSSWTVSAEVMSYVENIEYSNPFREGETILGAWINSRIVYRPSRTFTFTAGIFGNRAFGDEKFFTIFRPVLRAQLNYRNFLFAIGSLDVPSGNDFPDFIFKSENIFQPAAFEGLTLCINNRLFHQNSWVQWYALNTPSQREHFAFGNSTRFLYGPLSCFWTTIIDHHGGEQFAPSNDPVRENYCTSAGIDAEFQYHGFVRKIHGRALAAASATRIRSMSKKYIKGWGVLGTAGVDLKYFNVDLLLFKGDQLTGSLGNPIYQTEKPYCQVSFYKTYQRRLFEINGGLDLEGVNTDLTSYFKKFQHRWRISLTGHYDTFLGFPKKSLE